MSWSENCSKLATPLVKITGRSSKNAGMCSFTYQSKSSSNLRRTCSSVIYFTELLSQQLYCWVIITVLLCIHQLRLTMGVLVQQRKLPVVHLTAQRPCHIWNQFNMNYNWWRGQDVMSHELLGSHSKEPYKPISMQCRYSVNVCTNETTPTDEMTVSIYSRSCFSKSMAISHLPKATLPQSSYSWQNACSTQCKN